LFYEIAIICTDKTCCDENDRVWPWNWCRPLF